MFKYIFLFIVIFIIGCKENNLDYIVNERIKILNDIYVLLNGIQDSSTALASIPQLQLLSDRLAKEKILNESLDDKTKIELIAMITKNNDVHHTKQLIKEAASFIVNIYPERINNIEFWNNFGIFMIKFLYSPDEWEIYSISPPPMPPPLEQR